MKALAIDAAVYVVAAVLAVFTVMALAHVSGQPWWSLP